MSVTSDESLGGRMPTRPEPTDMALYARDMAAHLAAMAGAVGLIGLAALFRAAANEAAESLQRMAGRAVDEKSGSG